jgi:AcrR family transcriptional regulator
MAKGQAGSADGARPSLRQEQVEATRREIVAVARRRFGHDGYAATSVAAIARDARVTKGAVYHHFPTKEELFRAVYAAVEADAVGRPPKPTGPGPRGPLDVVIGSIQAYLDAALDPEVQRVTLIDGPAVLGAEPLGEGAEDPGHETLKGFLSRAMAAGEVVEVDADALALLIRGGALQAGLVIARSRDPEGTRHHVGAALEAMVRGLARDPSQT